MERSKKSILTKVKMKVSRYKTREQYEAEDTARHQKRLEDVRRRQEEKRAKGFDCPFDGCTENFAVRSEFNDHIKKHRDECMKAMKCTKPQCKDIKVRGVRVEYQLRNIDSFP